MVTGADCPYLSEQTMTPPSDGLESDDGGGIDITLSPIWNAGSDWLLRPYGVNVRAEDAACKPFQ